MALTSEERHIKYWKFWFLNLVGLFCSILSVLLNNYSTVYLLNDSIVYLQSKGKLIKEEYFSTKLQVFEETPVF